MSSRAARPPSGVAPWAYGDDKDGPPVSHGAYAGDAGRTLQAQRGPVG